MAVVDYTSSLAIGAGFDSLNDQYLVLGEGDIVTINFSGYATSSPGNDAIIATIPTVLVANTSNIFFTAYKATGAKGYVGGRVDSSGNIILNVPEGGAGYWIQVTYVRRTA